MSKIDLTGRRFGKLTVIGFSHRDKYVFWKCKCDCGNNTIVMTGSLVSGQTKSCGCLRKTCYRKNRNTFTGNCRSSWNNMHTRCYNTNSKDYKNYGGRGITVCEKWSTIEGFYEDMGDKPEGMSLERIDNGKGYYKENCKWATKTEQNNNRRNNVHITYNGKTQTIKEWANELGFKTATLTNRITRSGWTAERAFTTKIDERMIRR